MFRRIPDNFFIGVVYGAALLYVLAGIIHSVRQRLYTENDLPPYLHEPKPELVALLMNIFLFRFMVLRFKREQTGKGVLFITVVLVMVYYFGRLRHL